MWHPKAGDGLEHSLPLGSGATTQAVLDHLASGCLECGEALSWLSQQGIEGRQLRVPGPPEHAVETVKEAFAIPKHRGLRLVPSGGWNLEEA